MDSMYVLSGGMENEIRVLQRLIGILAKNRLKIEQMDLFRVVNKEYSFFNIAMQSDNKTILRVVKQLRKIIDLADIKVSNRIQIS